MLLHKKLRFYIFARMPWVRLISYTYKRQFIAELWWEYTLKTPVFCEILSKQRENLSKDTRAHQIGFLVLQAKGLWGFLKLPFELQRIIKERETQE